MMMAEDRRRAIKAELVEKSKSNPGYYKYQVTIKELDGSIHVVPSYGVDMQDAIGRIVKKERVQKFNKHIKPITLYVMASLWVLSVLTSSIFSDYRYAYTAAITLGGLSVIYALYDYVNKVKGRV